MKKYLMLILFCALLVACKPVVTNYAECIDAGYTAVSSTPPQCKTPDGDIYYEINSFEDCVAIDQPIMESYPRQCAYGGETFTEEVILQPDLPIPPTPKGDPLEMKAIAEASNCTEVGMLTPELNYNGNSKTWWITIIPKEEYSHCNPACVIYAEDLHTEINWRCTGLEEE